MPGTDIATPLYTYASYCGAPPTTSNLWFRWNLDPFLLLGLVGVWLAYTLAARRLATVSRSQRRCFGAGWVITALALVSPLCALSVSLFSARIGQHMILETIAAPLVAPWACRRARHGRGTRCWPPSPLRRLMAFWHAPRPYDATFESTAVYWAMHLTLSARRCGSGGR